jgi:hypothetical protein
MSKKTPEQKRLSTPPLPAPRSYRGWLGGPDGAAWISSADTVGNDRRGSPNRKAVVHNDRLFQSRIAPAREVASRQQCTWMCDESPLDPTLDFTKSRHCYQPR